MDDCLFLFDILPFVAIIVFVWLFGKLIWGGEEQEDYEESIDYLEK